VCTAFQVGEDLPVSTSAAPDWFRSPTWDAQIAANFEARLGRAHKERRAQYLRIQASHLLESPDPAVREMGRTLLRRVVAEYPDDFEVKFATEQLGDSLAKEGRLEEAEHVLRETLRLCAASPTGTSGTSGTPELRLAEVILLRSDQSGLGEAADLLRAVEPDVRQQSIMRDAVFRFLLASARVAHRRGDPSARELAQDALAVAAEAKPSLPRHRDVGRPSATPAEVAELHRIAQQV
jgi:hypothetical protein